MERNSFKEYSVLAMMSKEEKLPMKICLDNLMRTDSGTEVDAPNFGITTSYYLKSTMFFSRPRLKISQKKIENPALVKYVLFS